MENKGWEFSTTANWYESASTRGLRLSTIVNVSRNRNKVTELYNDEPFSSGFGGRVEAGKPIGFFYGHIADGIFQTQAEVDAHATQTTHSNPRRRTAPGDIRFRDINGDDVINDADRTMIGNPWPEL